MKTPRILAFAGSARTASYNKLLVKISAQGARSAGAEVTVLDLRDLPMPLFDEDLEAAKGMDPNARKFKEPLGCFVNKVAGIMSASPGALGGLRGLVHVRAMLGNIRVLVIPEQVAIASANKAFDKDGNLIDAKQQAAVMQIGARVADVVARLKG